MFCEKCGKSNPDEAKFCEGCGNPLVAEADLQAAEPAADSADAFDAAAPQQAAPNNTTKKIITIAVPVLLIVIIIWSLVSCGVFKPGYEKAFSNYCKAMQEGDGKLLYNTTVDPYILEGMLEGERSDYDEEQDVIDEYTDRAESQRDALEDEYGEHLKITYKIRKTTEYTQSEIEDIAAYLEERYDYDASDVQDVVTLRVRMTIEGEDDRESDTTEVAMMKVRGKWYVASQSGRLSASTIEDILDGDE